MHDGRFKKLSEVLKHYATGVMHNQTLSEELKTPIVLNANERVDIVAFLLTLTDRSFLFNPNFSYPKNLFLDPTKD
jgi:cytochrome c peroxidase